MQISIPFRLPIGAALLFTLGSFAGAIAQTAAQLSAEDSDPKALGWMQGFPPPPDKFR